MIIIKKKGYGSPVRESKKKNIILLAAIIVLIILIAVLIVFGCTRSGTDKVIKDLVKSGAADVMLMDYYYENMSEEEFQGYGEIVLYAIVDPENGKMSQEEVRMQVYTDGGLRSEKMEEKNIPYEAYERAREIVKGYDMPGWANKSNLIALDGALHVCKFPWNEEYIRVSSEAMPKTGEEAFSALVKVLEEYK